VILPLYLARGGPLAVLRFLGHGPGDWLGPIHGPDDTALAASALRSALVGIRRWDLLLAEHLPATAGWAQRLAGSTVRTDGFPMMRFQGRTWPEILAGRSRNFRDQVGRRERRLARDHKLVYRLTDAARLDSDLSLLFGLHRARWESDGSDALAGPRQAFHREFAAQAHERGWLRLWVMELDDVPAAVWYGFRYAGREWYYQGGWDPAFRAQSVGFVLLCHTIRSAVEDGLSEYWFLRGSETYKSRFADDDPALETVIVPHGLRGSAALSAIRRLDRLPEPLRRYAVARAG
jgi:CelD/BcsL family acetyltransferase involved in cellulose biosynthesis